MKIEPVQRPDQRLRNCKWPDIQEIDVPPVTSGDAFVFCAGFEDRALHFLSLLSQAGQLNNNQVIGVRYLPKVEGNREAEAEKICEESGCHLEWMIYDRPNPAAAGDEILKMLAGVKGDIWIDISGMSRLLIVQTIVALARRDSESRKMKLLYAEASEYPPIQEKAQEILQASQFSKDTDILLSIGVCATAIVPELSTTSLQGQPIRLVLYPAFNRDQLRALISELQPSEYSIIHGIPPRKEFRWRTEIIKKLNSIQSLLGAEEWEASTLDYRETLKVLLDIYERHRVLDRIVVSPTGSKMQAVAVALFRAVMDDVQIVYPAPREYAPAKEYTVGIHKSYVLDLGDCIPEILANCQQP